MEEVKTERSFNDIKIGMYILKKLIIRAQRNEDENVLIAINIILRQFQKHLGFNNFFKILGIVFIHSIHDVCYEIGIHNRRCERIIITKEEMFET